MNTRKKINPDNILSVSEYAKYIGKTTQRVYQLIKDGKIDVLKISDKIFVIKKNHA